MEGLFQSYNDLAARHNKENSSYFRGLVILDSDKNYDDAPEKLSYQNLKKIFGENVFHILEKRAMENYMPLEVFKDLIVEIKSNKKEHNNWKKMIEWIDVYLNLTDKQRDFVNICDGFPKYIDKKTNSRISIIPEILSFFGVTPNDNKFRVLDEGFIYKGDQFKNEFPLLFTNSSKVNKYTLNGRDGKNELKEILQKIYDLL